MTKPSTTRKVFKLGASSKNDSALNSAQSGTWIPIKKEEKHNKIKRLIEFIEDSSQALPIQTLVAKVENRRHLMASLYEALEAYKLGAFADQLQPGTIGADKSLVLQVSNGAIATKLQQRLPSILQYLQQQNWEVQSLKVKVSPQTSFPVGSKKNQENVDSPKKRNLSEVARKSLENLEKTLPEDSAVLQTVRRIIKKNK